MSHVIDPSPDLANVVRSRRQLELGLTRDDLAERLGWVREGASARSGFSPRTIVRLEKGERGLRNEREVLALCVALEIDRAGLFSRIAAACQAREQGSRVTQRPEGMVENLLSRIRADVAALEALLSPPPELDPASMGHSADESAERTQERAETADRNERPREGGAGPVSPTPPLTQVRWLSSAAGDVFLPIASDASPQRLPPADTASSARRAAAV